MATARTSTIRRFTAAEMEAMVAAGIVAARRARGPGAPAVGSPWTSIWPWGRPASGQRRTVELLDGEIICMAPIGNRHRISVTGWLT